MVADSPRRWAERAQGPGPGHDACNNRHIMSEVRVAEGLRTLKLSNVGAPEPASRFPCEAHGMFRIPTQFEARSPEVRQQTEPEATLSERSPKA